MEKDKLSESAWSRTSRDFFDAFYSYRWCSFALGLVAIIWEGYMIVAPLYFIPTYSTTLATGWIQAITFVSGMVILLIVVFLVCGLFTPYRQRDDARKELERVPLTPLLIDHTGYSFQLVGDTLLREKQYLWKMGVILTNRSDTIKVGTKIVSLWLHFPDASGKEVSYALSLYGGKDRDGDTPIAMERPLRENEYLEPHESKNGFYYFTDTDIFWKAKTLQLWPTLVVVDAFNVQHRREYKTIFPTTQSISRKEDSPT